MSRAAAWLVTGRGEPASQPAPPHTFDHNEAVPPDWRGRRFCRCGRPEDNAIHDIDEPKPVPPTGPVPDPSEPRHHREDTEP